MHVPMVLPFRWLKGNTILVMAHLIVPSYLLLFLKGGFTNWKMFFFSGILGREVEYFLPYFYVRELRNLQRDSLEIYIPAGQEYRKRRRFEYFGLKSKSITNKFHGNCLPLAKISWDMDMVGIDWESSLITCWWKFVDKFLLTHTSRFLRSKTFLSK